MRAVAQSLLVVVGLLGSAIEAQGQPQPTTLDERAQEQYQLGRALYRANAFEEAREAFGMSLQLVDSPNTRMYLGRVLRQLGRIAEAYTLLDRAALDAAQRAQSEPRYGATRDSARAEADALLPTVAMLVVRVSGDPAGATVTVNGTEVPRTVWGARVAMEPGAARIVLTGSEIIEQEQALELVAGREEALTFTAQRVLVVTNTVDAGGVVGDATVADGGDDGGGDASVEVPSSGGAWRTVGAVTMVSGGVALGGALAFGLLALNGYNLLDGLKISGRNDPSDPLIAQGETYRDVSNGLFVLGGTLFTAGLTFWLLGRFAWHHVRVGGTALTLGPPRGVGLAVAF